MYREAAYTELALTPQEFWACCPRDVNELLAGSQARRERETEETDRRIAYILAHVLSPYMKKGKQPRLEDFLPKRPQRPKAPKSRDAQQQELQAIKEQLD